VFETWTARAEESLEETAAPARREGLEVRQEVRRAIAAPAAILEYVDEESIDLVVMGTHGRRGLRHLALGSVAEEVLRFSTCPVLAVRKPDDESAEIEGGMPGLDRILVPVDFSRDADRALEYALDMARQRGAHLELLYVVENLTYPDFYYPAPPSREQMTEEISERAGKRLRERLDDLGGEEPATVDVGVEIGDPVEEVVARAGEAGSELIVMGSRGRTGLERILLGSVAEGVIRRAPCPVLVVKGQDDEDADEE
jgi:nucleotide-binding universal stress UspA family protein